MEIPKPSEEYRQFFLSLIPDDPAIHIKPIFGNLGAFVCGHVLAASWPIVSASYHPWGVGCGVRWLGGLGRE
jgi:hypothetical protein